MFDDLDRPTFGRWVAAQHGVAAQLGVGIGVHVALRIQSVGRLSAYLDRLDEPYGDARCIAGLSQIDDALRVQDYLYLSHLWVLDAYELVRLLGAMVRTGSWQPVSPVAEKVNKVRDDLAQVRVPLAKYEHLAKLQPKGYERNALPGDSIPFWVLVPSRGAAWLLDPADPPIARGDLGREVLELVETIARADR
ncbi:MAG: hypothetical protein HY263_01035 [Chloroflexi bacterium]|nr:hypothetical protein [Chloroflexota bacterium]